MKRFLTVVGMCLFVLGAWVPNAMGLPVIWDGGADQSCLWSDCDNWRGNTCPSASNVEALRLSAVACVGLVIGGAAIWFGVGARSVPPPPEPVAVVDPFQDAVHFRIAGVVFWCVDGPDPPGRIGGRTPGGDTGQMGPGPPGAGPVR